jgi:hypothetical protein
MKKLSRRKKEKDDADPFECTNHQNNVLEILLSFANAGEDDIDI